MKKFLKITSISVFSILFFSYLAFIFILPAVVKHKDFKYEFKNPNNSKQGLVFDIKDLKVSTKWNLSAGLNAKKINAYYISGEKFLQAENLDITLFLPDVLIKKITFNNISADKIIARLGVEKNGKFEIEQFIPANTDENVSESGMPYGLEFSDKMPVIDIQNYSIHFIDNLTKDDYSIKGKDFKLSDFVLNKKFRVRTNGDFSLKDRKQLTYNIDILSKGFPEIGKVEGNTESNTFDIISVFKNIYKYNVRANVLAKVKLENADNGLKTLGDISLSNVTAVFGNKKLPESSLNLKLKGDSADIISELYTSSEEKADINGAFSYGKNKNIDLHVKTNKIELKNLFSLVNAVLPAIGFNNIDGISANGVLKADFNVKSDFKTINSDGYLNVSNANISYTPYKVNLKNIQADVDFSSNQIRIKQAKANYNGAPLSVNGAIDTNAFANINVVVDKMPISGLLLALGQLQVLNENKIKSGMVSVNGKIKGNLDTVVPQVNVDIDNVNLYNKQNKASVILNRLKLDVMASKDLKFNGKGNVNGLKLVLSGLPTFSIPNSTISFNEKDINLDSVYVMLNNSKIDVTGKVTDYSNKKLNTNIIARGLLGASDIRSSLPLDIRNTINAKGKLPVIAKISGNAKQQNVNAQILANNNNYLSVFEINSLLGKTSLINADLKLENNTLKLNDISINILNNNKGITNDFSNNLSGSSKILSAKGLIENLMAKEPNISNLNLSIPNQLTTSIPGFKNSALQIKGDINVTGKVNNPLITGMMNIPYVSVPAYNTIGKNITVNMTKNLIDIYITQFNVSDSKMNNLVITLNSNLKNGIYIKNMEFNASNINFDSLSKMIMSLPQNANAPGTNMIVTIANGKGKIERITSGTMVATNVTSDFNLKDNLFTMTNIQAMAYNGQLAGNISYNMLYSTTKINMQGRGLNALMASYAFTHIKNLMSGTLDFDTSNLSTRGLTEEQIMQSLKGQVKFIVSDGQMGPLGKLENLLYAQNIISNNLLKATLGAVVGAVKVQKTGNFKYIKGTVSLSNGWAALERIQTSGSAMSMYIKGKVNILNNFADLIILGRLSNEVVEVLGPIGKFSVNGLIASIPKIGKVTSSLIDNITTNPSGENLNMLPDLSPVQDNTKEFKASIYGSIESVDSVKYFKWLSSPKANTETVPVISDETKQKTQQLLNDVKNKTQQTVNKIINKPVTQSQTTVPTTNTNNADTINTNTSTQTSIPGLADFINKLPDLKK